jgi:hypothetical protein
VDESKLRLERLQRLQRVLIESDAGGILLYDPIKEDDLLN